MSLEHVHETIQIIQQIANANTLLIGVAGFLCGVFVGNRIAIDRDKHKEFNDAALPVRAWIIGELEQPSLHSERPSAIELDTFISYLGPWSRMRFRRAYERERDARHKSVQQDTDTGAVFLGDDTAVKKYLAACLPYTNRR